LNVENHNFEAEDNVKVQITQLVWKDFQQANIRCRIFRDKFDKKGSETLASNYLRYVILATSLQPLLSEYSLLGTLTSHYPTDLQKFMVSANLKTNHDTLTFLGKMQASESFKNFKQDQNQKDFTLRQDRDSEANRNEIRREYQPNQI
jgi:hypothetical protein